MSDKEDIGGPRPAEEGEVESLPTEPKKKAFAKTRQSLATFSRGSQRNSESITVLLTPLIIWLVQTKLGWDIPVEVLGSMLALLGVIAARVRARIEFHDKLAIAKATGQLPNEDH